MADVSGMGSDVGEHGVRVVAFGVEIGVGIVFGDAPDAETLVPEGRPALRFYRTRAGLSQQDLAFRATVSHDVISKIETGERPPAGDFPPRLDAVPELDTRGALTRLWDHLKKGQKQRPYGSFQQWADIEAQATVLRWYEPLVVPGLLQTEDYARAILSARPDGNLDELDEQVAARLARQAISGRTGAPQLWCILDEGVLHRAIGGSKVMRSQLYHLAEVADHCDTGPLVAAFSQADNDHVRCVRFLRESVQTPPFPAGSAARLPGPAQGVRQDHLVRGPAGHPDEIWAGHDDGQGASP